MRRLLAAALALTIVACGIDTAGTRTPVDALEDAAEATAELADYRFEWTAEYELADSDGGSGLTVSGAGTVDGSTGDIAAIYRYDPSLAETARRLFPADEIGEIESESRIVGDSVFVRGFNAASIHPDSPVRYDQWYDVTSRRGEFGDPFVRSGVLPAEALPVIADLMSSAELVDDTYVAEVERDAVLELGERFTASLFDFGLRLGGGDFVVSAAIEEGVITSVTFDGDDELADVERFRFEISFLPGIVSSVAAPDALPYPSPSDG